MMVYRDHGVNFSNQIFMTNLYNAKGYLKITE